ncbi:MAG: MarR family transcriptional regulator [Candidatus Eisenbacteria bacterium]
MGEPVKTPVPVAIEARLEVCQIIGRMMELWGFRKNLGRIWTLLFLSDEPISAGEIGDHLSLSRGSTSMALQELLRWGVVRKSWKPGERKDFFEAEQNVAKMVLRVLNERELPAIDEAIHGLGDVLRTLDENGAKSADPVLLRRTGDLLRLTESGRTLFKNLVGPSGPATPFLKGFGAFREDRS